LFQQGVTPTSAHNPITRLALTVLKFKSGFSLVINGTH